MKALLVFLMIPTMAIGQNFVHDGKYKSVSMPLIIDSAYISNSEKYAEPLPTSIFKIFVNDEGVPYNYYENPEVVKAFAVGKIITSEGVGYMTLIKHQSDSSIYLLFTIKEDSSNYFSYATDLYARNGRSGDCWSTLSSINDIEIKANRGAEIITFKYKWTDGYFGRIVE